MLMRYLVFGLLFLLGGCVLFPEQKTGIELDTVQAISQSKSGELLVYVDYPVLSGVDTSMITDWIDAQISQTRDSLHDRESLYLDDVHPELHGSFEIIDYSGGASVLYTIYQYVGGTHGTTFSKIFVFNHQGEQQHLSDIVGDVSVEKLYSGIVSYGSGDYHFEQESVLESLHDYLLDPNFYLLQDDIVLVFQPHQLLGSDSVIEIAIPMSYFHSPIAPTREVDVLSGKLVALTFDDGPNNKTTPQIIDILQQHDAVATFYVLGRNVSRYPEVLQKAVSFGNEIGSHSRDHQQLTRLSSGDLLTQRDWTDDVVMQAIGTKPATYRPPYGSKNDDVISAFHRPLILWTIDTRDRKSRNPQAILQSLGEVKHGDIILLHDIYQSTVDAVEDLIVQLQQEGFSFVTVSELLAHQGINLDSSVICSSGLRCK